jgi:hypothetical protein
VFLNAQSKRKVGKLSVELLICRHGNSKYNADLPIVLLGHQQKMQTIVFLAVLSYLTIEEHNICHLGERISRQKELATSFCVRTQKNFLASFASIFLHAYLLIHCSKKIK